MCVVSMVGDHYRDIWIERWPPSQWPTAPATQTFVVPSEISRAEFEELKREVQEMKKLLTRAKEYDAKNGEPNCEMDEKMDLLRKVAKLVGISLDDVIGNKGHHANHQ